MLLIMWGSFMKNDNFLRESIILTVSNLTTGILGFIFSIILSKELGPEGMGLYGLVMPIYNLFICLICGGMVTAISKVAAIYFNKGDFINLHRSIGSALRFDFMWAFMIAAAFFIASPYISSHIINDSRTLYALKAVSPALVFVALSAILKGYFYGISKARIPAFIDILEKTMRIVMIVSIISILVSKVSIDVTVTVAFIALSVGEFTSLVMLYTCYKFNKTKIIYRNFKRESRAQLLFDILIVSMPLCINGVLSDSLSTASSLIIPRRLVSTGLQYSTALSLIGKFTGMAMAIIFFPNIVINSISTILIPNLSQALDKKDYYALENRISQVLKIAFLLGMSTLVICISIPNSLGKLFFDRSDLGSYIKFAALSAPVAYLSSTTFGILNGLGKQGVVLRNSLIVSIEELILLYIFTGIPSINIFGYGITLFVTSLSIIFLNFGEIKKYCSISLSPNELFIYTLLSILIYLILNIANNVIPNSLFTFKNVFIILFGFMSFFLSISIINKESRS